MVNIDKNNIVTINRGDSFTLNIPVNLGTTIEPIIYQLQENDKVYFGLMEPNQHFENAIIRKVFTDDDQNADGIIEMSFGPEQTEHLLPGVYYYMIKLEIIDGQASSVYTILSKTIFNILD